MGTWKDTLTNVKQLVEQSKFGYYPEARRLLQTHLDEEHKVDNDLSELQRLLASYQQFLVMANRVLLDPLNYKMGPDTTYANPPEFLKHELFLRYIKQAEEMLAEFELKIKRLQRDGKLETGS